MVKRWVIIAIAVMMGLAVFPLHAAQPQKAPDPASGPAEWQGIFAFYQYTENAPSTTITIKVIDRGHAGPESLIRAIGDALLQNRLNKLAARPLNPFKTAIVASGIISENTHFSRVMAECDPAKWEQAIILVEQTIRSAARFGFSKKEFQDHLRSHPVKADNAAPITLDGVNDAFAARWKGEDKLFAVTGNAVLSDDPQNKILEVIDTSLLAPLPRQRFDMDVSFPYLPEPMATGKIQRRYEIPSNGIIAVDYENGCRLNLKPTRFQPDEILFALAFGRGRAGEPSDKPGIGVLLEAVMKQSGIGGLTRDQVVQFFAGSGVTIDFKMNEDVFLFLGRCRRDEISYFFQLLHHYTNDPAIDSECVAKGVEEIRRRYEKLAGSIQGGLECYAKPYLHGGDPRFGMPAPAEIDRLTRKDLMDYLTANIQNTPWELSVVGDFEPGWIMALAARYIGSRPPVINPYAVKPFVFDFPYGKEKEFHVMPKAHSRTTTGLVNRVFPVIDLSAAETHLHLDLIEAILNARLRGAIQENPSVFYTAHAKYVPIPDRPGFGMVHVAATADMTGISQARKLIHDAVKSLATHGITEAELEASRNSVIEKLSGRLKTNPYWLMRVLMGLRNHPSQTRRGDELLADYEAINKTDLENTASLIFDQQRAATIMIMPYDSSEKSE